MSRCASRWRVEGCRSMGSTGYPPIRWMQLKYWPRRDEVAIVLPVAGAPSAVDVLHVGCAADRREGEMPVADPDLALGVAGHDIERLGGVRDRALDNVAADAHVMAVGIDDGAGIPQETECLVMEDFEADLLEHPHGTVMDGVHALFVEGFDAPVVVDGLPPGALHDSRPRGAGVGTMAALSLSVAGWSRHGSSRCTIKAAYHSPKRRKRLAGNPGSHDLRMTGRCRAGCIPHCPSYTAIRSAGYRYPAELRGGRWRVGTGCHAQQEGRVQWRTCGRDRCRRRSRGTRCGGRNARSMSG